MERLSDDEYLRRVEDLAREVVGQAGEEGWLSLTSDPSGATGLQCAVNELARELRHLHDDGDGCVDH
jgi:hypothetical protein